MCVALSDDVRGPSGRSSTDCKRFVGSAVRVRVLPTVCMRLALVSQEFVYETVKNFTVKYDKPLIFDKIHHELNQVCVERVCSCSGATERASLAVLLAQDAESDLYRGIRQRRRNAA